LAGAIQLNLPTLLTRRLNQPVFPQRILEKARLIADVAFDPDLPDWGDWPVRRRRYDVTFHSLSHTAVNFA
jgi:hypothetical protein